MRGWLSLKISVQNTKTCIQIHSPHRHQSRLSKTQIRSGLLLVFFACNVLASFLPSFLMGSYFSAIIFQLKCITPPTPTFSKEKCKILKFLLSMIPNPPPLLPTPKDYVYILRLVGRSVSSYTSHSIWHVASSQLILVVQITVLNKDFILSFSTF